MKYLSILALSLVLLTPTQLRERLSRIKSISEWKAAVEQVKRENGGRLPEFWQREIIDNQYFDGLLRSFDSRLRKSDDEK